MKTQMHRHRHSGIRASAAAVGLALGLGINGTGAATPHLGHAVSNSGTLTIIQPDGAPNLGQPAIGASGNLYGVTGNDGTNSRGTLWSMTPSGSLTILHDFTASEGWAGTPLVAGSDGSLYGATTDDQASYPGAVPTIIFKLSSSGQYSVLHTFATGDSSGNNADGAGTARLAIAADGTVYGVKARGGAYDAGTAFKISPSGSFTLLHTFGQSDGSLGPDGGAPYQIVVGKDGTAYGLTAAVVTPGPGGSMFLVTPGGSFSVVATPSGFGANEANLAAAADGNVYGTVVTANPGSGYLFKVTPAGQFSTVYTPTVKNTGMAGLVAGTDGNLYADVGNSFGESIVKVTPAGKATTLHTFNKHNSVWECDIYGCFFTADPRNLDGGGVGVSMGSIDFSQGGDGYLYGFSPSGGTDGQGAIWRLATDGSTDELLFTFGAGSGTPLEGGNLVEDSHGNFYGNAGSLFRLNLNGSMKADASFPSTVDKLGTPTAFSWTSTGAASCTLSTNISNVSTGVLAPSGSMSVTPILDIGAVHVQLTPDFVAGVICVSADGKSFASASAQVHAPTYFGP